jgi:Phenazine biosynthesis protein A/B
VTIKDGKISHMKEWSNPLKYLEAAHLEIPKFLQKFDYEKVAEARKKIPPRPEYDLSPEAIAKRAYDNVHSFIELNYFEAVKKRTYSKDYRHAIWYAPPDMKEEYDPEDYIAFDLWIDDSLTREWHGQPDPIPYSTDDPRVFFFESGGYGIAEWMGNGTVGGYVNRYMKYLELDDQGFIKRYDETLNPINKLNSINKPLPGFPYMF